MEANFLKNAVKIYINKKIIKGRIYISVCMSFVFLPYIVSMLNFILRRRKKRRANKKNFA